MDKQRLGGHAAALSCELVWGTTFAVTKLLQENLAPSEILSLRFVLGYLTLFARAPRRITFAGKRRELLYAGAGLSGVVIYFLLENYAVHFTLASNVGVIVSICPFFTALLAWKLGWGDEKPGVSFFIGFLAAMAGIVLINWNGVSVGGGSLLGDSMTVLAAFSWAVYSMFCRRITDLGEPVIESTRHIFLYGLLWMLPCLPALGFSPSAAALTNPGVIGGRVGHLLRALELRDRAHRRGADRGVHLPRPGHLGRHGGAFFAGAGHAARPRGHKFDSRRAGFVRGTLLQTEEKRKLTQNRPFTTGRFSAILSFAK